MDEVEPHRLCHHCKQFVEQANCLTRPVEDVSPHSFDPRTYRTPVVNCHKSYPSLEHIFRSGQQGCHLCSILTRRILANKPGLQFNNGQAWDSCDTWIFSKLHKLSYYRDPVAAFHLSLYSGDPWRDEDDYISIDGDGIHLPRKNQQQVILGAGVLIKSLSNDQMRDCKVCQKCMAIDSGRHHELRGGEFEHAACRWTTYTGSDSILEMIRSWLQRCINTHPICASSKAASKPTRVLDLTSFDDGYIRLAPGTEMGDRRYIALSYQWGGCDAFALRRHNIDDFSQSIELQALPKTFFDAVVICRKLGFDFLWGVCLTLVLSYKI